MVFAAVAWIALLLAAPFLPTALSALTYAFGSLICHQIPERSFHLQAFQLPVCARCFGIYSGAAAGTVWMGRLSRDARRLTTVAAVPTLVTLALEWAGLWYPSNATRAIAGAPLGFVVAFVLLRATLHYD